MPDLHSHVLTVRGHGIMCCDPVIVQHGMGHDALAENMRGLRESNDTLAQQNAALVAAI